MPQFRLLPRFMTVLVPAFLVSACVAPPVSLMDNRPGITLARGESANMHFFTNIPDFDSGLVLEEGASYALDIRVLSNWIDGNIEKNENGEELDETGFANSQMPFAWFGKLRRSTGHRWFELMLYQPQCTSESLRGISELAFNESSGSYQFVAACDGKLALFVNDSYVTYANNRGYANIALSRVN